MTTSQFNSETSRIGGKLMSIYSNISRTTEVLDRLLHTHEQIEVEAWGVRAGKIFVTFTSPVEIEHVPKSEQHIQRTLTALFPTCRISGTTIEIEAGELL
jgi:hypothetical protein